MKHRAEVIKNAKDARSSARRRPAPAPPVTQGVVTDRLLSTTEGKGKDQTHTPETGHRLGEGKKSQDTNTESPSYSSKFKNSDTRRGSAQSEINVKEKVTDDDNVRKSKSVTSSIGQAPSLVSSYSSNASEVTTTSDSVHDSSKISNGSNPFEEDGSDEADGDINEQENPQTPVSEQLSHGTDEASHNIHKSTEAEDADYDSSKNPFEDDEEGGDEQLSKLPPAENQGSKDTENVPESQEATPMKDSNNAEKSSGDDSSEPPLTVSIADESFGSVVSSNVSSPTEDLPPPPPPEVYDDISAEQFEADADLPPAPPELCPAEDGLRVDDMYVNLNSDILELCGQGSTEECNCDNYQPKFDVKGKFFAR